jgi:hypothetical protein
VIAALDSQLADVGTNQARGTSYEHLSHLDPPIVRSLRFPPHTDWRYRARFHNWKKVFNM